MTEDEQRLRAFLDDLTAICKKHGMAILNADEYGISLTSWRGWSDERRLFMAGGSGSAIALYDITPDGHSEEPKFHAEYQA